MSHRSFRTFGSSLSIWGTLHACHALRLPPEAFSQEVFKGAGPKEVFDWWTTPGSLFIISEHLTPLTRAVKGQHLGLFFGGPLGPCSSFCPHRGESKEPGH